MKKILFFIENNHNFIKEQSELFALSMIYFVGSFTCLKYIKELLYFFGFISGVTLLLIATSLGISTIKKAETYIKKEYKPKGKLFINIIGLSYVSVVASLALAIFYESIGM